VSLNTVTLSGANVACHPERSEREAFAQSKDAQSKGAPGVLRPRPSAGRSSRRVHAPLLLRRARGTR